MIFCCIVSVWYSFGARTACLMRTVPKMISEEYEDDDWVIVDNLEELAWKNELSFQTIEETSTDSADVFVNVGSVGSIGSVADSFALLDIQQDETKQSVNVETFIPLEHSNVAAAADDGQVLIGEKTSKTILDRTKLFGQTFWTPHGKGISDESYDSLAANDRIEDLPELAPVIWSPPPSPPKEITWSPPGKSSTIIGPFVRNRDLPDLGEISWFSRRKTAAANPGKSSNSNDPNQNNPKLGQAIQSEASIDPEIPGKSSDKTPTTTPTATIHSSAGHPIENNDASNDDLLQYFVSKSNAKLYLDDIIALSPNLCGDDDNDDEDENHQENHH